MNVGTLPDAGVEAKAGVGEEDSKDTILERGTAVGFVERSDTEGEGRVDVEPDGNELTGTELTGNGVDEFVWAFARCEDKRMVMVTNWRIDGDILENGTVVADGAESKERSWRKGEEDQTARACDYKHPVCRCQAVPIISRAHANILIPGCTQTHVNTGST